MLVILCVIAAFAALVYSLATRRNNYWKKLNVPYLEPTLILGNYGDYILQKKHMIYVTDELCKKFPDEPYIGTFFGTEPALIVKDPELLKLVLTKDFYHFNSREALDFIHKEALTQNLFATYGDQWKVLRQNISPVFSSAKMKNMFHLIETCSHHFEKLLDEETKVSDVVDAGTLMARFTMACITSCHFGVDSDTLNAKYKDSPFTISGDTVFAKSRLLAAKNMTRSIWPGLFYFLGFQLLPLKVKNIFMDMVISIFEARQYKSTLRNDFIDFLLTFKSSSHMIGDSMKNSKTGADNKVEIPVTDELLLSQVVLFFMAGFETSAATTSFTMFELAKNIDVQKKVQEEVDAYLKKYDNKLTYDIVTELPYTYACVEETLRMFPVGLQPTREVTEDYTLPTGLHLKKGSRIHIPVYYLHNNPKYYKDPEVFRPERFLGEERRNLISHAYLPFGEGPRSCIGMRFAKMQMLAGLVTILKKYSLKLDDSTPRSAEFHPLCFIPSPKAPLNLKTTIRESWESRQFKV